MINLFRQIYDFFVDKCWHDWEVVRRCNFEDIKEHVRCITRYSHKEHTLNIRYGPGYRPFDDYHDKVCLTCGACRNTIDLATEKALKKAKDKQKRKENRRELSQKLWKERCKGK